MSSESDLVSSATKGDYTIKDWRDDMASPSPPLKARLIESGVDLICSIHQNFPIAWLADNLVNDGKIAPEHILLDDLCRPRNQVPPTPIPPFSGGQCEGAAYYVEFTLNEIYIEFGEVKRRSENGANTIYGKIDGFNLTSPDTISQQGKTVSGSHILSATCGGKFGDAYVPGTVTNIGGNPGGNILIESFSINNVTRTGGQPDNCGNPGIKYPPALPSPSDLVRTSPIAITPTLTVPVRVEVKPTLKFDPTVIAPVLVFNAGGLNVKLDLGGFTFSPNFGSNNTTTYPNTNPSIDNSTKTVINNNNSRTANKVDIDLVVNQLKDVQKKQEDCCDDGTPPKDPDEANTTQTSFGSANSATVTLPVDTFKVILTMVSRPAQEKVQFGDNASDVIYAGWVRFRDGEAKGDRQPVDGNSLVFRPPASGYKSFEFKLYTGYNAILTAYSKKPKPK